MTRLTIPAPLPIAQLTTPLGEPWYIAHARSHQGFVVQRCYQPVTDKGQAHGSSTPSLVQSYFKPFLNHGAVQAAGLEVASIQQWIAAHPDQVFTHPTYAALCLRWGKNTYGYEVTALRTEPVGPNAIPFTPHTCWQSGTTYYQLAIPERESGDATDEEALLLARLQDQAGLVRHQREVGQEGAWQGWYTTNRSALEQVLDSLGYHLVLAQPHFYYGMWVQMTLADYADGQEKPLSLHNSANEAQARFSALQQTSGSRQREGFPRLTHGYVEQWPGRPAEWTPVDSLRISESLALASLEPSVVMAPPRVFTKTFADYLAAPEQVPHQVPPTLAETVAATGLSRVQLATALGWPPAEVNHRLQHLAGLTMREVTQIAHLTQLPVGQLASDVSQEMQRQAARLAADAQRMQFWQSRWTDDL